MAALKRLIFVALVAFVSVGLLACDDPEAEAEPEQQQEEVEEADEEGSADDEGQAEEGEELAMVEVSEEGTEVDPPVQKAQIEEGTWICDMGTVHYARAVEGDGECPLCGMDLVEYGGDPDHHHDHGDQHHHDHDHDHHQ